jgi:hypothetical protein
MAVRGECLATWVKTCPGTYLFFKVGIYVHKDKKYARSMSMSTVRAHPAPRWLGKPECRSCKHHYKGSCRLFVERFEKNVLVFLPVKVVRMKETLCGPSGTFWESSDFDSDQIWYQDILSTQE